MIFLEEFSINQNSKFIFKDYKLTRLLRTRAIWLAFEKSSADLSQIALETSHVITWTNYRLLLFFRLVNDIAFTR